MKFKELVQLGNEEKEKKLSELRMELLKLNTQVATGTPPKNAGSIRRIKKDIARLLLAKSMFVAKKEEKATIEKPDTKKEASKEEDKTEKQND